MYSTGAMAQDLLAMGCGDAVHVDRATDMYQGMCGEIYIISSSTT